MSAALLHERFPELRAALPHLALGERPTPVRRLPGLSEGGAPVWLKDDGAFGAGGWGGNKVRKLEWILPEARRRGARTILTVGGLGTNWGLAAALYAREQGLHAALALVDQPLDDHVRAQLARLKRCGAALHFTHTKARTIAAVPWLVLRHARGGRPPYVLPAGGSSPVGTLGYVEGAFELAAQVQDGALPEPSHVVTALGSGGTAAGLALGLRLAGLRTRVGVSSSTTRCGSTCGPPCGSRTAPGDCCAAAAPRFDPWVSTRPTSQSCATGSDPATGTIRRRATAPRRSPPSARASRWNRSTPPRRWRRCSP